MFWTNSRKLFSLQKDFFVIKVFAAIEKGHNRLVECQVNIVGVAEHTNRVPVFFCDQICVVIEGNDIFSIGKHRARFVHHFMDTLMDV